MLDKQFEKKALKWKNIPSKRKPELEKWIQKQKEKYHWTENNGELLYCIKNKILDEPKCLLEGCNKKRRFVSSTIGYRNGCSKNHNTILTCRQKYNCDNPFQNKTCKEKYKKTNLKKYGSEFYITSNDFHNKVNIKEVAKKANRAAAKKNLEKYGAEYPFQLPEIQDKVKETNLKKYGYITPLLNKDVKNKTINTNLEKYGEKHHFSNKKIQNKIKKTLNKKYGVDNPAQAQQTKEKIYQKTYFDKINTISDLELLCSEKDFIGVSKDCYKWKCKKCLMIFEDHLKNGNIPSCPKCNPKTRSNMENEFISEVLTSYSFIKNYLKLSFDNGRKFELDFLIENKLAVELNGNFWHSEIGGTKSKNYHLNKTKHSLKHGFKLIHIFEDEWLFKREIVKSIIHSKLGTFEKNILSSNCVVKMISTKEKNNFLKNNHLRGEDKSSVKIGLLYNNQLVSVLTLKKSRFNKNYQYEISRFCNKTNYNIKDSFETMIDYFKNKYKPDSIISFVDKRISTGSLFKRNNFNKINESNPTFFVLGKNKLERLPNYKFKKHMLEKKLENFDKSLNEWENLKNNGYDRIWDCGYITFGWKK